MKIFSFGTCIDSTMLNPHSTVAHIFALYALKTDKERTEAPKKKSFNQKVHPSSVSPSNVHTATYTHSKRMNEKESLSVREVQSDGKFVFAPLQIEHTNKQKIRFAKREMRAESGNPVKRIGML